ncbi:fructose-bisphosphate aldolase [Candidatus Saccharibacteria bacterium]|nr:fructose-bisphosphate aldolase [Candidatus Saccharibacteria bacterium]
MSLGKEKRLKRIFSTRKIIICPVDDSLIFGPKDGLENLDDTMKQIEKSGGGVANAVLGFAHEAKTDLPFILNLTASTTLSQHTRKIQVFSVQQAVEMGADCVAAHINFGSQYESEMLKIFSEIAKDCAKYGMPLLAIAYPRSEKDGQDDNFDYLKYGDEYTDLVCHTVRAVVELGADIVKTQYTGDTKSFKKVINAALGKPVVIAGGKKIAVSESYNMAKGAILAGASGVSFGRNVFNADNITEYLIGLRKTIDE